MDMKEKLVELLEACVDENVETDDPYVGFEIKYGSIADRIIADGWAKPEWISVKDRLPESQNPVLVVAVSKGMGLPYIFKAAHINHHEITEDEYGWTDGEYDSEYDEENDCFWIPECWYECNAVEGNTNWVMDEDYTITHWMPLPQPPKGE